MQPLIELLTRLVVAFEAIAGNLLKVAKAVEGNTATADNIVAMKTEMPAKTAPAPAGGKAAPKPATKTAPVRAVVKTAPVSEDPPDDEDDSEDPPAEEEEEEEPGEALVTEEEKDEIMGHVQEYYTAADAAKISRKDQKEAFGALKSKYGIEKVSELPADKKAAFIKAILKFPRKA